MHGVRWVVALALIGCGSTPAPVATVGNEGPRLFRVPECTRDPDWSHDRDPVGNAALVTWNGSPAVTSEDGRRPVLKVQHLETQRVLASVTLPVPDGSRVYPAAVIATPQGPAMLVMATEDEDDYLSPTSLWLVRFDAGEPTVVGLPAPARHAWFADLIAVGEHLVLLARFDGDEGPSNYVAILDASGKPVHQLEATSAKQILAVGPTTFGVVTGTEDEREFVRVFDADRLAWTGSAVELTRKVLSSISIDGETIVIGTDLEAVIDDSGETRYEIASLDAAGSLTSWRRVEGAAHEARLFAGADANHAYLITSDENFTLRLFAVDATLRLLPAKAPLDAMNTMVDINPVMVGGSLYVADLQTIERFNCQ
jgi:hypothetical protein